MSKVRIKNLWECTVSILRCAGVPEPDAEIVADSVVYAHCRGKHTHGIGRMPIYVRKIKAGLLNAETPITYVKDTPVVSVVDVHNGFGQVAAAKAMNLCIEKARVYGIGVVGVKDSNNFGTAGFIGEIAEKAGMIGVVLSNSGPAIAPTGGYKAVFGTNPVCVAFPAAGDIPPIIFDMACSNVARGKIRLAAKNGEQIPLGWAVDADGNDTSNPDEALKGTMIPIGGYKGYGIALCVDILAGMMTGSGFGGMVKNLNHPTEISKYGHLIMAMNPEFFMTSEDYFNQMHTLVERIKGCGSEGMIYLPGEKSFYEANKNTVVVEIKQNLIDEFNVLAGLTGAKGRLDWNQSE